MSLTCSQCRTSVAAVPADGRCPQCHKPWVAMPVLAAEVVSPSQPPLSKLAIASFIFSFLICLPILNAGIALGLGIGALATISSSKGELRGRGLAVAGIVIGCFSVVGALPMFALAASGIGRYVERSRLSEIRVAVQSLGQKELDYYQVHGQFLRVPPMPLVRPVAPMRLEPTEVTKSLGWTPPETTRYQFEVDVDGSGPEAKARVTADMANFAVVGGGPPPHEEVMVTSNGLGTVTEVPTALH